MTRCPTERETTPACDSSDTRQLEPQRRDDQRKTPPLFAAAPLLEAALAKI